MTGWLIVNGFLASAKFTDLYALLTAAFEAQGITLLAYPNTAFLSPVDTFPFPTTTPSAAHPDFILFWDKDVALAQRFEQYGVRVFNSASAIYCCDDKIATAQALARAYIPTPKTILIPKTFSGVGYTQLDFLAYVGDTLGYPFVLKEAFGSFGQQVHLIANEAEARSILAQIKDRPCLAQEFVSSSRGRDLRINVVGDDVVATLLRKSTTDFRSNVTLGGTAQAYAPTAAEQDIARAAVRAVGASFAGVDVLFGPEGTPFVCEVNSNPHFRSTLAATGVNLATHIACYVSKCMHG